MLLNAYLKDLIIHLSDQVTDIYRIKTDICTVSNILSLIHPVAIKAQYDLTPSIIKAHQAIRNYERDKQKVDH